MINPHVTAAVLDGNRVVFAVTARIRDVQIAKDDIRRVIDR